MQPLTPIGTHHTLDICTNTATRYARKAACGSTVDHNDGERGFEFLGEIMNFAIDSAGSRTVTNDSSGNCAVDMKGHSVNAIEGASDEIDKILHHHELQPLTASSSASATNIARGIAMGILNPRTLLAYGDVNQVKYSSPLPPPPAPPPHQCNQQLTYNRSPHNGDNNDHDERDNRETCANMWSFDLIASHSNNNNNGIDTGEVHCRSRHIPACSSTFPSQSTGYTTDNNSIWGTESENCRNKLMSRLLSSGIRRIDNRENRDSRSIQYNTSGTSAVTASDDKASNQIASKILHPRGCKATSTSSALLHVSFDSDVINSQAFETLSRKRRNAMMNNSHTNSRSSKCNSNDGEGTDSAWCWISQKHKGEKPVAAAETELLGGYAGSIATETTPLSTFWDMGAPRSNHGDDWDTSSDINHISTNANVSHSENRFYDDDNSTWFTADTVCSLPRCRSISGSGSRSSSNGGGGGIVSGRENSSNSDSNSNSHNFFDRNYKCDKIHDELEHFSHKGVCNSGESIRSGGIAIADNTSCSNAEDSIHDNGIGMAHHNAAESITDDNSHQLNNTLVFPPEASLHGCSANSGTERSATHAKVRGVAETRGGSIWKMDPMLESIVKYM